MYRHQYNSRPNLLRDNNLTDSKTSGRFCAAVSEKYLGPLSVFGRIKRLQLGAAKNN